MHKGAKIIRQDTGAKYRHLRSQGRVDLSYVVFCGSVANRTDIRPLVGRQTFDRILPFLANWCVSNFCSALGIDPFLIIDTGKSVMSVPDLDLK